MKKPCLVCGGKGSVDGNSCPACCGEGEEPADDIAVEDLPKLGSEFARKAMVSYLDSLHAVMTPRYMSIHYLAIIFGGEILSAFGEKMLIDDGFSKEKIQALRAAIRNTISKSGDKEALERIKTLLN